MSGSNQFPEQPQSANGNQFDPTLTPFPHSPKHTHIRYAPPLEEQGGVSSVFLPLTGPRALWAGLCEVEEAETGAWPEEPQPKVKLGELLICGDTC